MKLKVFACRAITDTLKDTFFSIHHHSLFCKPVLEKQKASDTKANQKDEEPMQKELMLAIIPPDPLLDRHSITPSIRSSKGGGGGG